MKKQFVTHEIALILKEKGFHEPCFCFYRENGQVAEGSICFGLLNNNLNDVYDYEKHQNPIRKTIVTAPLWQQVIDWLREKHNLRIFESTPIAGLSSKSFNEDFRFELVKISGNGGHANSVFGNGGLGSRYQTYTSYNEARQAAIEHALTLI